MLVAEMQVGIDIDERPLDEVGPLVAGSGNQLNVGGITGVV